MIVFVRFTLTLEVYGATNTLNQSQGTLKGPLIKTSDDFIVEV